MFRRILVVVGGNHIYHIVAGECGGSVKANQVHLNQLWCNIERYAWPIVYKVVSSVPCPMAVNIRGGAVASVAKGVRKGKLAEKTAVG